VKGRGHAVRLPVLDIAEVGAGGGSIVWVDRGGALKVGPQSAGAAPGPACYGTGGAEATVTDANVVLGYISPERLAGGAVRVLPELAARAIEARAAGPLGMSLADAALGVHTVANTTMIRALKAVSTYRGRDPREFALFAFGGNGPVHAAGLARALGISMVVVPPAPGLFSAVGMLEAEPEHHFVQTFLARAEETADGAVEAAYREIEGRAKNALAADGYTAVVPSPLRPDSNRDQGGASPAPKGHPGGRGDPAIKWRRRADMRYAGQAFELTVDASAPRSGTLTGALVQRFHAEHQRTYGHHAPGESVELVNLRVAALLAGSKVRANQAEGLPSAGASPRPQRRDARFEGRQGFMATPVIGRDGLGRKPQRGPLIVEEYDATTVVPPGCTAALDAGGNIVISVGGNT
jgi:N-methylhydantoinase A